MANISIPILALTKAIPEVSGTIANLGMTDLLKLSMMILMRKKSYYYMITTDCYISYNDEYLILPYHLIVISVCEAFSFFLQNPPNANRNCEDVEMFQP